MQIPNVSKINVLILRIRTNHEVSLEEYIIISSAVESRLTDNVSIWYGNGVVDHPDCCQIEVVYWIE